MSVTACNKLHFSAQKFFYKRKQKKSPLKQLMTIQAESKGLTPARSSEKLKLFLQPSVISYSRPPDYQISSKIKTELIKQQYRKNSSHELTYMQNDRKKTTGRSPDIEKKSPPKIISTSPRIIKVNLTGKLIGVENTSRVFASPFDIWKKSNDIKGKVFVLAGNYPDVRKALKQRGWTENEDQESPFFDLKWSRNARIPLNLLDWQLYNHFPRNFELSAKWQLYENLKKTERSAFYHLHFFPRSFRLDSKGFEEFFEYFKGIHALSLLKNYVKHPAGHVIEKVIVASIIGKRFILEIEKENYKNNRISSLVMNFEWKILISNDLIEIKTAFSRLMLGAVCDVYANAVGVIEELKEKDPQFFVNGHKNIWIVKAGRKSRGRDIALFNNIEMIKLFISSSSCWVVQKYIENPLIICNKKFDIRQWVLVSCSDPLTIWVYKQCYLRFSIENYSDEEISNPYIHLTNNSISKKSKKFETSNIEGCMWSLQQFQDYLIRETGNDLWTSSIFPAIKKIVKTSLLTIGNLGRSNSFELFGYDFMLDDKMKPWLLEVNSSPAMDYSTVNAI